MEVPLDANQAQVFEQAVAVFVSNAEDSIGIQKTDSDDLPRARSVANRFLGRLVSPGRFTVALDHNEVWGFSLLCSSPTLHCDREPLPDVKVDPEHARRLVMQFLARIGQTALVDSLEPVDNALKCRAGCFTYRFAWQQPYDESGVAYFIANVEVELDPFTGLVVRYAKRLSRPSEAPLVAAERCRALVEAAKPDPRPIVSWRLVLYEEHLPDGGRRPFWTATYKLAETANPPPNWGREQEHDAFIDGLTGEVTFE